MPSDYIDVQYLSTFAGMVVVLMLIVQFTKSLIKKNFADVIVRWYCFIWAIILLVILGLFQGTFYVARWEELLVLIFIMLVNAILLTWTAMGGYESFADPGAEKTK